MVGGWWWWWSKLPRCAGLVLAHLVALLARWGASRRVVEVCPRAGDVVLLDPFVVHAPSVNGSDRFRFTFQLRTEAGSAVA